MQGRAIRVGKAYLYTLGLQIQSHARHGSPRAGSTNEPIQFALGLHPYFRPGGLNVRLAIGSIVKLIGPYGTIRLCFGQFLGQTPRIAHIIIGVFIWGGRDFDKLCTRKAQHIFFLLALRFGYDDHRAKAH